MTKKQRIQIRAERRDNKLCLDCGHNELANNKDGSQSKYCTTHLAIHSTAHRNKRRDARPVIVRPKDIEIDEDGNPLPFTETKRGLAYALTVRAAVRTLATKEEPRVTLGQIKRFLGDDYELDHTLDTLNNLTAIHCLEYRQMGAFWSWIDAEPPVEKEKRYNNSAAMHRKPKYHFEPVDRTRPAVESFPGGAA